MKNAGTDQARQYLYETRTELLKKHLRLNSINQGETMQAVFGEMKYLYHDNDLDKALKTQHERALVKLSGPSAEHDIFFQSIKSTKVPRPEDEPEAVFYRVQEYEDELSGEETPPDQH